VRVDYDATAPFARYRTYAFQQPPGTQGAGYTEAFSLQLQDAARRELDARGLRYAESSPDLLVGFDAQIHEKMRSAPVAYGAPGSAGYRMGHYATWPGYGQGSATMSYTVGTLHVDLVDVASKQLVWEGVVTGIVTDSTLAARQPAIDRAVAAALAKYPPKGP